MHTTHYNVNYLTGERIFFFAFCTSDISITVNVASFYMYIYQALSEPLTFKMHLIIMMPII